MAPPRFGCGCNFRVFDLDGEAIVAALSPRTRAVIVNTPHNPTGRIYPTAALQRLADGLATAGSRTRRPRLLRPAHRGGGLRPARSCRRAAGLLPHLADGDR